MKMNTKHLSKAASLLIAATLAGCAGDEKAPAGQQGQQPDTKGMTEFAMVEQDVNAVATRTSGEYTGAAVKFYWTSNDQLWINNTASASPLKASNHSTIPTPNGKEATAKFWFEDRYTAPDYPVRYTGNSNTAGDKVIIKSAQAQQAPNDGAHIGTDGDCGTATAHRQGDGSYLFTLDHKASYLTFMPCYSSNLDPDYPGFASSVKLTQIKVSADQPLAGTYSFDDTGLKLSTATATSKSITITLAGGGTNGFEIPVATEYGKNAAIMVVAPGSYTNFTVEYTLHDQVTNITGTVKKNYGSVDCHVGRNKKIAPDLDVPNYSDTKWAMWDAHHTYWQEHESTQPRVNGETGTGFATEWGDPRWYSNSPAQAVNLCAQCPNINEMMWYISNGDAHWDATKIWCVWGHLYQNGMWLLKRANIPIFNSEKWWDGKDWRVINHPNFYLDMSDRIKTTAIADADRDKYFYLPAFDNMDEGNWWPVGKYGTYWASTPTNETDKYAYALLFAKDTLVVRPRRRWEGDVFIAFE